MQKEWLNKLGFQAMTEVQKQVIPMLEGSSHLCVTSPTGTGKTHAFLVPLISKVTKGKGLQALILAPTSVLSKQLADMASHFFKAVGSSLEVKHLKSQTDKQGPQEIMVATPFQVLDAVTHHHVMHLKNVHTVIIDEADMMLDQGFIHDLEKLFSLIKDAQVGVFSATMHPQLMPLLKKSFQPLKVVDLNPKLLSESALKSRFLYMEKDRRIEGLLRLLNDIQPFFAIVFGSTKKEVEEIYQALKPLKKKVEMLSGDLTQRERNQIIKKARNYDIQYLVASDIAARGMDLPDVSHVINISLPKDPSYFIHRIGRTARIGKPGMAVTFYDRDEKPYFDKLKLYGFDVDITQKDVLS